MLNIFKKNSDSEVTTKIKPKTILCIPGNWKSRNEIVTAIAENCNGYIFAGLTLLNLKTNKCYTLEVFERDESMAHAFKCVGMVNRISDAFIKEVDKHTLVIYLSGETGDLQSAKDIAEAGHALLNAGGIGIKVETTGKAFTKNHWSKLLTNYEEVNLYQMFVIDSINDGNGRIYTCGMHNLGLKDCIVYNEEFHESANLLSIFGYYQIIDKPVIQSGHTFRKSIDSPKFKITEESHQPNIDDEYYMNPYGMWKLERLASYNNKI